MIKECLPKVGIKLLKISQVRILFLVSILSVAVINPYSVFLFLNILVYTYVVMCYVTEHLATCNSYNMGNWDLPDTYALTLRPQSNIFCLST